MAHKKTAGRITRAKKHPACPACKSPDAVPIVHGLPTRQRQRAIDRGEAVLADREDWEGMAEWHCKACGCDWSGTWRRFKKPPGTR